MGGFPRPIFHHPPPTPAFSTIGKQRILGRGGIEGEVEKGGDLRNLGGGLSVSGWVLTPPQLVRGREGELELLKEQLGAGGAPPPEGLSDEELPLDPRLYQELCAGAMEEHGLVSGEPKWGGGHGNGGGNPKRALHGGGTQKGP